MMTFLFLALASASTATLPASDGGDSGRTAIVQFSDLHLSTLTGRAALDRRVKRAVRRVCEFPGPGSPTDFDRVDACRDQAWKDASRQVELALASSAERRERWASR